MRLVIESDHPYQRLADCLTFLDAGVDVVLCGGPAPDQTCPALDGQPCPVVEDADAVLNDVDDEATRLALAKGVRATSPDVPMVVVMPPGLDADLPPRCVRYVDDARTVNHATEHSESTVSQTMLESAEHSTATGPEWLLPAWLWPAERPTVRFSPELRTASELVAAKSGGATPNGAPRHAV